MQEIRGGEGNLRQGERVTVAKDVEYMVQEAVRVGGRLDVWVPCSYVARSQQ